MMRYVSLVPEFTLLPIALGASAILLWIASTVLETCSDFLCGTAIIFAVGAVLAATVAVMPALMH